MGGGVLDGQSVDQSITNAAFLYKNANDSSTGVYTLLAPTSGPQINDIQLAINVIINGVGGTQSTPATAYSGVPANTISNGDTHVTALQKLADKFFGAATAGGHTHSGADGDGAHVSAVLSLAASGGTPLTGAVTLSQGLFINFNEVGQNIQINVVCPGLPDVLAVNNAATAGINFNGGAISGLSYADWSEAGFPPGFPVSGHLYLSASADDHFYLRTSASATRRVDATLAASGSSALYGDVVIAASGAVTLSQSGQTITVYAPAAAASGSAVNSIAASGSSALTGAVVIVPGTNVTLSQVGQNITINGAAGATPAVVLENTGYSLGTSSTFVYGSAAASSFIYALPNAVGNSGLVHYMKRTDSTLANVIYVATSASQTIDGYASSAFRLSTQNEALVVISNNTNWDVVDHKTITPFTAYTPTISASVNASGITFFWRRIGDSVHVRGFFSSGATGAALATIALPAGLSIDTTKAALIAATGSPGWIIGEWRETGQAGGILPIVACTTTSTTIVYCGGKYSASNFATPANASAVLTGATFEMVDFLVPVLGWLE